MNKLSWNITVYTHAIEDTSDCFTTKFVVPKLNQRGR